MGKGRIDDAHLHRNAVDRREGEAYDEVEGTDAAGYRNCEAKTSDEREEEGVDESETVEERRCPHDGRGHEPVCAPDEGSIGEEEPFAVHAQTAREALEYASEYAPDLAAEGIGVAEAPEGPESRGTCNGEKGYYPPYAEIKAL